MSIRHYILIDPFNTLTSGVTTYVGEVRAQLMRDFPECAAIVIARRPNERIDAFRKRVSKEVLDLPQDALLVEAPESLAATRDLPDTVPVHIRLHGSREFGRWLQGQPVDRDAVNAEQREIHRARLLSAPSMAAYESSKILSRITRDVHVYPNPVPPLIYGAQERSSEEKLDILFIGRWQELKGIRYLERVIESLDDYTFAVACSIPPANLPKGVTFLPIRSASDRYSYISRSKLVIVPSLFETASMVGLEALAAQRIVVTWDHIGLVEYAVEPSVFGAVPGSLPSLCDAVKRAMIHANRDDGPLLNPCAEIQNAFRDTLEDLINNNNLPFNRMPVASRIKDWTGILNDMRANTLNSGKSIIVKRKFKKLMRDPVQFFLDSSFMRLFRRKDVLVQVERPSALPLRDVNAPESTSVTNPAEFKMDELTGASSPRGEWQAFAEMPVNVPAPSPLIEYTLGHLGPSGKVSLKEPPTKPSNWTTVLVHCPEDRPLGQDSCRLDRI